MRSHPVTLMLGNARRRTTGAAVAFAEAKRCMSLAQLSTGSRQSLNLRRPLGLSSSLQQQHAAWALTGASAVMQQRRGAFYDTVAAHDPFFARLQDSDVYGIFVVTDAQVNAALRECSAAGESSSDARAAAVAVPLFNGVVAMAAVLRHSVLPEVARCPGEELVFARVETHDPDTFEPLTRAKIKVHFADMSAHWRARSAEGGSVEALLKQWRAAQAAKAAAGVDLEAPGVTSEREAAIAFRDLDSALVDLEALLYVLESETFHPAPPAAATSGNPSG